MTLTVKCNRMGARRGSSNQHQQRSYTDLYKIIQTDTGSLASEEDLITAAQAVMTGDPLPIYGDNRTFAGTTDPDSYAQSYDWEAPESVDYPKLLHVTVNFLPADSTNPGKFVEPDPLMWPTEYWVEWTEEQVVLTEARNVEELEGIDRGALTLGKVVNACGVEFSEPLMKTVYYPVLHCQKYYATLEETITLNYTFQNTTNNGTFFGATKRAAKYLGTETGRIQKVNGQSFYVGITRIWFKKTTTDGTDEVHGGWDRPVLNNGWSHFVLGDDDLPTVGGDGNIALFKNKVHDSESAVADDPDADPDTACSEPLNLGLLGELKGPQDEPEYINYRDLAEVDYTGIGIGGV